MKQNLMKVLALFLLFLLPGCCSERNPDGSSLPWSRPAGWENGNPLGMGAIAQNRHVSPSEEAHPGDNPSRGHGAGKV